MVAKGRKLDIEAEISESGHSQVEEFLRELAQDPKKKACAAGLAALFQTLADTGVIQNSEVFKKLTSKVFEFKAGAARVSGGFLPGRFLITNGFLKKSRKTPARELDMAEKTLEREEESLNRGDR